MKISDALAGIQRLYAETAPLIYYVEENPLYVAKMDAIIATVEDRPIEVLRNWSTISSRFMDIQERLGSSIWAGNRQRRFS